MKSKKTIKKSELLAPRQSYPELLAPAGNLEKMKTAFAFGADAVYAGIPDFSLRVRINDFTLDSLKEAIEYAHNLKKKIYVTINIFAHNKHLKKLPAYVKKMKELKPDGFIVSDPGVMQAVREIWPKAEIHLSTQANCTNWQAAKFWYDQGLTRVVLGREVTLAEVKEIKKKVPALELETFVHGAMCMAYSGRCFLSKYFLDRSANLGDCAQPCRWKYNLLPLDKGGREDCQSTVISQTPFVNEVCIQPDGRKEKLEIVEEEHGSYILNSQDMCMIKRIPELMEAGIDSFKIEGRAKSVYYLASVVWAYRRAIDIYYDKKTSRKNKIKFLENLHKELEEKLSHRGYTESFMFEQGKLAQNLDDAHQTSAWEFCGQAVSQSSPLAKKNKKSSQIFVKIHNSLYVGDEIEIIPPGCDIIKMKVKKIADAKTGEEMSEAHGGQKKIIILEANKDVPEFSVIRRKVK